MGNINAAVKYTTKLLNDVTVISREGEEIQTNKYLLSLFSPSLRHFLSNPTCVSPTLLLPDCSAMSIKCLLDIIEVGFTYTQGITSEDIKEVSDVMSIDIEDLQYDNVVEDKAEEFTNFTMTVKQSYEERIIINSTRALKNEESQQQQELWKMFHGDDKDARGSEAMSIDFLVNNVKESTVPAQNGEKRQSPFGLRSKFGDTQSCDQCDYHSKLVAQITQHKRSVHEGVRYSCRHCDYKARQKAHLRKHNEYKHEGVRYPCDQCEYKATTRTNLKRHIRKIHFEKSY